MTDDPATRALEELAARLGTLARRDAPLGGLTTYRVGGNAALFVEARKEDDLVAIQSALAGAGAAGAGAAGAAVPLLVLGNGSNLLVADAGFPGLVVHLAGSLAEIAIPAYAGSGSGSASDAEGAEAAAGAGAVEVVVRAGGGAGLPVLARRTVDAGLTGLEWAVGIPGTVGGALKMNAGGHGSDTASCLAGFRCVDLLGPEGAFEAGPGLLELGYRNSSLGDAHVVVWADLLARPGDRAAGKAALSEIVHWRREHQPGGSNAGSVFTNPSEDSAGRLVEAAGLKGFRLRTAQVSEKHANFIQADDTGSADDVLALIRLVRTTVADRTGVVLRPEVRLVGFGAEALAADPQVSRVAT